LKVKLLPGCKLSLPEPPLTPKLEEALAADESFCGAGSADADDDAAAGEAAGMPLRLAN
jgi:hypothetical protein